MDASRTQRLLDLLFFRFEREGTSLYAVLDGARDRRIYQTLIHSDLEYGCLLAGRLAPDLMPAAPYLVKMLPGSPLTERLLEQGWGRSHGLFLAARADMREVRRHLRSLLSVQTEDHKRLFFRYYDPRVLRVFLPTCRPAQLNELFGPIQRFDMEDPDGASLLRFRLVPEPSSSMTLRSWTYSLSSPDDAADDRGYS